MDLSAYAGFSLHFREEALALDLDCSPATRILAEMEQVVFDKAWYAQRKPDELQNVLYLMYRGITRPGDEGTYTAQQVRPDITIIPPFSLGVEPVKTQGHFHPLAPGGKPYPEIYQVLGGKAVFIEFGPVITENEQDFGNIDSVKAWHARAGQFVVLELGGHVTVNPSPNRPLILLNLVSSEFESIYSPVQEFGGAPYFYVRTRSGFKFEQNENYAHVPPIETPPLISETGPLLQDAPIYKAFLNAPEFFAFLTG